MPSANDARREAHRVGPGPADPREVDPAQVEAHPVDPAPIEARPIDPRRIEAGTIEPRATDPDVDLHLASQRAELRRAPVRLIAVIAAGGAFGACARYALALAWPTPARAFPWTTLVVNGVGCAAIGLVMVAITEVRTTHPLVRPFLVTGVLGGFTTFSTYAVDASRLVDAGRPGTALAYLALTPVLALAAVAAATSAARRLFASPGGRP